MNNYSSYILMGLNTVSKNIYDCDTYHDLNEEQRNVIKEILIKCVESK